MSNTLLWGTLTEEHRQDAAKNRYYLIGTYRVLAYGSKVGGLTKADDAIAASLDDTEREWLGEAIRESAARQAKRRSDEIDQNDRLFMERFEQELEAAKKRYEEGRRCTNGGDTTALTS